MAYGGHGEIAERVDNTMQITLRQEPCIWNLEQTCIAIYRHGRIEGWTVREFMDRVKSKKSLVEFLSEHVLPCVVNRNPTHDPVYGYPVWEEEGEEVESERYGMILWHVKNVAPQFLKPTGS